MSRYFTNRQDRHFDTRREAAILLNHRTLLYVFLMMLVFSTAAGMAAARDLDDVLKEGKLRHLGIPYANFVSGQGEGLDVEMMKLFAAHLGVAYEFVASSWGTIVPDLTGKIIKPHGNDVEITGNSPIRGDVIATGFTVLPWRQKIVAFSTPTFPSGVWLIARANVTLEPITPTGDITKDIIAVKAELRGRTILAMKDSCLDAELYKLDTTGAVIKQITPGRDLDEVIPMVVAGMSDATLMDVPVALVALEKLPGNIKVIGPVSAQQDMAYAFDKSSPDLREAFEKFFKRCKADGTYYRLVKKYYPTVFTYYPEFFSQDMKQ